MEFDEKMAQWRESSGLTRKEFARKLSVSLTAVKNWETGHSTPKLLYVEPVIKSAPSLRGFWNYPPAIKPPAIFFHL